MIKSLFRVSVSLALVGIVLGIVMGIKQDFTLMPAHAHLNLLGFVTMFLSALYYRSVPEAAASRLAAVQAIVSVAGAVVFPIGIASVLLARTRPVRADRGRRRADGVAWHGAVRGDRVPHLGRRAYDGRRFRAALGEFSVRKITLEGMTAMMQRAADIRCDDGQQSSPRQKRGRNPCPPPPSPLRPAPRASSRPPPSARSRGG